LPAHAKDKPIEVWFQDEARVGQKGSLTHIWAERGSRPPKLRDLCDDSYVGRLTTNEMAGS
jgi:hypothetical protein